MEKQCDFLRPKTHFVSQPPKNYNIWYYDKNSLCLSNVEKAALYAHGDVDNPFSRSNNAIFLYYILKKKKNQGVDVNREHKFGTEGKNILAKRAKKKYNGVKGGNFA